MDITDTLQQYPVVIVSGPQRSGTRIGAKVLACDLDYKYIDEQSLEIDSLNLLCRMVLGDKKVIQCPALSRYVYLLASKRVAVVFMMRNTVDIIASQERIGWQSALPELLRHDLLDGEPSTVKYAHWQKVRCDHCYELNYLDLAGHHLWVNKANRVNFSPEQTVVNDE